jgi:hypothetical protein
MATSPALAYNKIMSQLGDIRKAYDLSPTVAAAEPSPLSPVSPFTVR